MPVLSYHKVRTAWGFLALRLPEKDAEWMGYRVTTLKALGVLDNGGNPIARLDVVKAVDMARLTEEDFNAERNASVKDRFDLKEIWRKFCSKMMGHIRYYGVSNNGKCLSQFRNHAVLIMFKWLNRRMIIS
nr:hypothetical protein [uncultured Desulfobacter sp.]